MKPEGFLIKENQRFFLKVDKAKYPISHNISIPSDLLGYPSEDYDLQGSDRNCYVSRIVLIDDDGEFHKFNESKKIDRQEEEKRREKEKQRRPDSKHVEQRIADNDWRCKNPAFAPYNFVPLNDTVVIDVPAASPQYSGYLDVTLTANTPFFIGNEMPARDQRSQMAPRSFFRMLGNPFVPGSSLRGLTRSLVEILSWSEMGSELFTNKKLSFRSMAEMGDRLRAAYEDIVPRNIPPNKAGYLFYEKFTQKFYVRPAEWVGRFDEVNGPKDPVWEGSICKVYSGMMPGKGPSNKGGKKQQWKLGAIRMGDRLDVPNSVVKAYRDDATRSNKLPNVLEKVRKATGDLVRRGYPVFYNLSPDGEMVSLGHTGYHRIPYRLSIGDHVSQTMIKTGIDFATSIFGTVAQAGRVWFEDCQVIPESMVEMPATFTKPLLAPKPTTFQHYLEQPGGVCTPMEDLRHWGDDHTPIRGHKQYWHRLTSEDPSQPLSWAIARDPRAETKGTDQAAIKPLSPGTQFKGRIRFDGLSDAELGALLYALSLPEGCCHKLGLGKPIGLGSIRIGTILNLVDRSQRYAQLWEDGGKAWQTGITEAALQAPYKLAFARAVGSQINWPVAGPHDLWQHPRLKEFQTMLTFLPDTHKRGQWLKATRYMVNGAGQTEKEYRLRPVLPRPTEVKARFDQASSKP
jgi:hypothetical protein